MALPTPSVPYGAWASPLAAGTISAAQRRLSSLRHWRGDAALWVEMRPAEQGRYVLCTGKPKRDLTPPDASVRTRVHEYGGGAWTPVKDGAVYVNFADQRLWHLPLRARADGEVEAVALPSPLTPAEEQGDDCRVRYAAMVEVEVNGVALVICVREGHAPEGDVENYIAAVPLAGPGRGQAIPVLRGHDFYAHPSVHVDAVSGAVRLVCVAWNHPNMPWDDVDLLLVRDLRTILQADGTGAGSSAIPEVVFGSGGPAQSIVEPRFDGQGRLFYYSDINDKYNLFCMDLPPPGAAPEPRPALLAAQDLIGAGSLWIMGTQTFDFLPDGRVVTSQSDPGTGSGTLVLLNPVNFEKEVISDGLPNHIGEVTAGAPDTVFLCGGGVQSPTQVFEIRLSQPGPASSIATSVDAADEVDEAWIPVPEKLTFPTSLNGEATQAFAWYYPPTNPNVAMKASTVSPTASLAGPPLLVKAHGGPHGAAALGYRLDIAFWTSRGWAVLDVDYGGSMGYGRAYRRRLTHPQPNWGIVDIADVTAAATFCVTTGRAREGQCAIEGGSAGGYTTLACLVFGNAFQCGCSMYGVSDLALLAAETHKFEARYLDRLVGAYPDAKDTYDARSPLKHCERLTAPLLLLQGDEDKIVPPNQAEIMHDILLKKGLPTALVMFKGEQHGFRKQENIEACWTGKLYFFSKVFGLDTAEDLGTPFEIPNLA